MTFVVFFLWEIVRGGLLHPIQYLFVGFAICVFYLLLLSISEHVGFGAAYAIAAGATTLLIALYLAHVLGGMREGVLMGCGLTTLYAFLYLLLRLEEYALLAGSVGLFLMLALLMLATRRVNWYERAAGQRNRGSGRETVTADVHRLSTTTLPSFITQRTPVTTSLMFSSGFPSMATMSAANPGAIRPSLSFSSSNSAAVVVAVAERLRRRHPCLDEPFELAGVLAEHREHGVGPHADLHARLEGPRVDSRFSAM